MTDWQAMQLYEGANIGKPNFACDANASSKDLCTKTIMNANELHEVTHIFSRAESRAETVCADCLELLGKLMEIADGANGRKLFRRSLKTTVQARQGSSVFDVEVKIGDGGISVGSEYVPLFSKPKSYSSRLRSMLDCAYGIVSIIMEEAGKAAGVAGSQKESAMDPAFAKEIYLACSSVLNALYELEKVRHMRFNKPIGAIAFVVGNSTSCFTKRLKGKGGQLWKLPGEAGDCRSIEEFSIGMKFSVIKSPVFSVSFNGNRYRFMVVSEESGEEIDLYGCNASMPYVAPASALQKPILREIESLQESLCSIIRSKVELSSIVEDASRMAY